MPPNRQPFYILQNAILWSNIPYDTEVMAYQLISRIIKRRSVANDACTTGHVTVNGREAKPGTDVKVGDILGIRFGEKYTEYEILSIAEHAAKQDASSLYRVRA